MERALAAAGPPLPPEWPAAIAESSGAFELAVRDTRPEGDPSEVPVVLVHGLGSSSLLFARAWPLLASANLGPPPRVIAIDLPGFGETRGPSHRIGLDAQADHVLGVLERRGLRRAHWVGHSMGAQIALRAALVHPARVAALSLVSPAGLEPFDRVQRRLLLDMFRPRAIAASRPAQIRMQMNAGFHRTPPEARWLIERRTALRGRALESYARAFAGGVRSMLDAPVHDDLERVTAPTLLVIGAHDALVPNRYFRPRDTPAALVERARARMPRADVRVVPEAGHLLPFERPRAFARLVRAMQSAVIVG